MITTDDILVIDADLMPTVFPTFPEIHIWYQPFGLATKQDDICGSDFFDWLCKVEGKCLDRLQDYWYSVPPRERDSDLRRYMVYRANKNVNWS